MDDFTHISTHLHYNKQQHSRQHTHTHMRYRFYFSNLRRLQHLRSAEPSDASASFHIHFHPKTKQTFFFSLREGAYDYDPCSSTPMLAMSMITRVDCAAVNEQNEQCVASSRVP